MKIIITADYNPFNYIKTNMLWLNNHRGQVFEARQANETDMKSLGLDQLDPYYYFIIMEGEFIGRVVPRTIVSRVIEEKMNDNDTLPQRIEERFRALRSAGLETTKLDFKN